MNTETDATRQQQRSLLVLGHITRDIIRSARRDVDERLGGAASFAALAAAVLGYKTNVVTAAPPDSSLLELLHKARGVSLHIKPCPKPTTFELDYTVPMRRLRLVHRAPELLSEDIPQAVRGTPMAYVCPVMGECGLATIRALRSESIVVSIQGWLRRTADDGRVEPTVLPDVKALSDVCAVCYSEFDHPESKTLARELARRVDIVALTRGTKGVTLFRGDETIDLPAIPANEVDPTGAGDVFAVVFGLALHAGKPWVDAAEIAMRAAARVVEGPGMGRLSGALDPLLT